MPKNWYWPPTSQRHVCFFGFSCVAVHGHYLRKCLFFATRRCIPSWQQAKINDLAISFKFHIYWWGFDEVMNAILPWFITVTGIIVVNDMCVFCRCILAVVVRHVACNLNPKKFVLKNMIFIVRVASYTMNRSPWVRKNSVQLLQTKTSQLSCTLQLESES